MVSAIAMRKSNKIEKNQLKIKTIDKAVKDTTVNIPLAWHLKFPFTVPLRLKINKYH